MGNPLIRNSTEVRYALGLPRGTRFVSAAAAALLIAGCPSTPTTDPNADPNTAVSPEFTGTFTALPLTVCAGEPVTLAWNVTPQAGAGTPVLSLYATTSGGPNPGLVKLDVSSLSGSRVVNPTGSAGFSFSAVSDLSLDNTGAFFASRAVTVLTDNVPVNLTLTIGWGCENVAGGPGWETLTFDAGEFASTNVRVSQVRNVSGFPVTVFLTRGGPGGTPVSATLNHNAISTSFNGGLFLSHSWTALPSPGDRFADRPQTCAGSAAGNQPSNIQLQVTLECTSD